MRGPCCNHRDSGSCAAEGFQCAGFTEKTEDQGDGIGMHLMPRLVCCRLGSPDAEMELGNKMFVRHTGQWKGRRQGGAEGEAESHLVSPG